jgi:hypothetical protein
MLEAIPISYSLSRSPSRKTTFSFREHVVFPDTTDIEKIVRKERIQRTKFTEWMEANKRYLTARELTYRDFPTKFVWKKNGKI